MIIPVAYSSVQTNVSASRLISLLYDGWGGYKPTTFVLRNCLLGQNKALAIYIVQQGSQTVTFYTRLAINRWYESVSSIISLLAWNMQMFPHISFQNSVPKLQ